MKIYFNILKEVFLYLYLYVGLHSYLIILNGSLYQGLFICIKICTSPSFGFQSLGAPKQLLPHV